MDHIEDKVNQKIKNILKDLHTAHAESEKFYGKRLNPSEQIKPVDIFDMALAFENEQRLLVQLDLAYSEKFPDQYPPKQIDFLKKEIERLTYRIRAWQNRQFPSQVKE